MSNKKLTNSYIQLSAYVLPKFNADNNTHEQHEIASHFISLFTVTTSVNKLLITGSLTFTDLAYDKFVPYMMDKYPPVILVEVNEVTKSNDSTKPLTKPRNIFKHYFLINNIAFNTSANRIFNIDLKLVSAHAIIFNMFSVYSNNNINWPALNILDDIKGIFNDYTEATGAKVNFINNNVFGVTPQSLKRRIITANNTLLTDAVLSVVKSAYVSAADESIISDNYTSAEGGISANKLVGYTIDVNDNSPTFFRLDTDDEYSVKLDENDFTKRLIPIQFNGTPEVDNRSATVAFPPTSSYLTLMQNFSINRRIVKYSQQLNTITVSTKPDAFSKIANTYLADSNDILSDAKDWYTSSNCAEPPKIPPKLPVNAPKYVNNRLHGFLQTMQYGGTNSTSNTYDNLMTEVIDNNTIYLNIPNSVGHKVGQVIDLIVRELGENNAVNNYDLNLLFSGKWKIVASNWEFLNSGTALQYNETLSLTRFKTLTGRKT